MTEHTLVLDDYERDNLLWLIQAVVVAQIKPLTYADTGDWICQILYKLEELLGDDEQCPNMSHEELSEWIKWWKEQND